MTQLDDEYWIQRRQELQEQYREFLMDYGIDVNDGDRKSAFYGILIVSAATKKAMAEVFRECDEPEGFAEMISSTRHSYLRQLWTHDLLDSPFRILVDREFPGKPPGMREFERYAAETADRILLEASHSELLDHLQQQITSYLDEHDYTIEIDDEVVVAKLVAYLALYEVNILKKKHDPTLRDSAERAVAEATDPEHSAWQATLARFFPRQEEPPSP